MDARVTNLDANTTYNVQVRGVDEQGNYTAWSKTYKMKTVKHGAALPYNAHITWNDSYGANDISVGWVGQLDEDSFNVMYQVEFFGMAQLTVDIGYVPVGVDNVFVEFGSHGLYTVAGEATVTLIGYPADDKTVRVRSINKSGDTGDWVWAALSV